MINQLHFLKSLPNHIQRSSAWFEQRKNKLTSSDAATALGINPYKKAIQLLLEKCGVERLYESNENTLHGQKYEDEAVEKYENLMGKTNHIFGMISFADLDPIRSLKDNSKKYIDPKYHFLGGSPDGIVIDKNITSDSTLIQLEVKCPLKRKIKHGQIPDYYFPQIQLNMFIMDIDVTDFIEYVPPGIGKNVELNIVRIYRDEEWFDKNFPILENFWKDVEYWRQRDITTHPEYNNIVKNKLTDKNNTDKNKQINAPMYLFINDNEEEEPTKDSFNDDNGDNDDNDVCLFE